MQKLFKGSCLLLKHIYIYLFIWRLEKYSRMLFYSICSAEGDKSVLSALIFSKLKDLSIGAAEDEE